MRRCLLALSLALALAACGDKSKPTTTPTDPAVTEPAPTEPAAATDAEYQRIFEQGLAFFDELAASIEASGSDCKKMASELDRIFTKYQSLSADSKRLEGNADFEGRMQAYMKEHEEQVKAASEKMAAGMQACAEDADVQAAMKRFDEM